MKSRMDKILQGRPLPQKDKKPIAKKSAKRLEKEKKEAEERGDGDTELQKWYRARMKVMGTRCYECGATVEHHVYRYAINSICHILPKRKNMCPSVKTHPANWITLCPDHHDEFDKISWEEKETWGCWPIIQERLIHVYECLDQSELRHFPQSVLDYIEKNKPF